MMREGHYRRQSQTSLSAELPARYWQTLPKAPAPGVQQYHLVLLNLEG
jgi:hypothetical protein